MQGLQRYMLNAGFYLAGGMLGVLSTVNSEVDIAPDCDALLDGPKGLKE
jgi:hypothetical protein